MEDILSVIHNFLEIVFFYTNPVPIASIDMENLTGLGKATIALATGGVVYGVVVRITGRGWAPVVISICMAMMGTIMMPDGIVVGIILLYCGLTRIIDGLGSGLVLGSWLRKPFVGSFCLIGIANAENSSFHDIYSLISGLFGVYSVFRLARRIPALESSTAIPLAIGFISVLGVSMIPVLGPGPSFLLLALYPVFLIIGFFAGFKKSEPLF